MADKKMYKVGITVKEPWASDISYEVLDITLYAVENGGDGCSYIAIKANQGVTPGTDDTVWVKATQRGQSIYDLAVKYGDFEGTEAEFEAEYEAALHAAQSAAQSASAIEAQVETNETARVTAERARSDAETARSSAETARINAENARVDAESLRDIAESDRVRAEAGRVTAEASRVEAETFRQGAEQSRRQQFEGLKTDMETAIDNVDAKAAEIEEDIEGYETNEAARVSAEQARATAESARVSAESARATAETARETQALSDHTRAETDHGTAASDHTTAQADHTQAASDHTDITRARLDAETATSEANMASLRANGAADTAIAAAADATEAAGTIDAKIATKQDVIADLPQIREGATDTVKYSTQSLTDAQKTQARANIGAAGKDGYYPEMSVGSLKGTEVTQVEGITTIAKSTGLAKINEVMGRSLVWNQLKENGDFSDGLANWSVYMGTGTVENGVATVVTNTESTDAFLYKSYNNFVPGHKYLMMTTVLKHGGAAVQLAPNNSSNYTKISGNNLLDVDDVWTRLDIILTMNATSEQFRIFGCGGAVGNYFKEKNFVTFDLTQLFGSGNEPSTVAEFESWLANNIGYRDYYAYNAGEIISNNTEKLEITGLNQWDGTYVDVGYYLDANGDRATSQNYNTTDYIKVSPNTAYYAKDFFLQSASAPRLCWYDAEKNFISSAPWSSSNIYTSPSNASYIRLSIVRAQASTACISVSGSSNGEYEPYQKSELELNLATITGKLNGEGESVVIFPEGMRSAGTVFDSLIVDEDGWCRRAVRRMTVGLMENFSWRLYGQMSGINCWTVDNLGLKGGNNILSVKYPTSTSIVDKTIRNQFAIGTGTLWCYDNSYSTVTEFKAGLVGQKLIYPLSTPQEYVLDTPIQMTFQAKHGGVIRQLPENGSEPTTAPMRMSVTYALDAVSILTDLPENYVSKESLQAMLSAMQSAGLFSAYTMTFNESTGKYEFTFTANA